MVNTRMASYTKYQDLMHQLQEYIRYKELPEFMSRRIFEYYDYHFQKRFYKEREIMSVISDRLQEVKYNANIRAGVVFCLILSLNWKFSIESFLKFKILNLKFHL